MVHISLPRGLSSLGHKHKDKDAAATASGSNGDGRPSPPRLGSNNSSTAALVEQKPLILKVYVIKVPATAACHSHKITNCRRRRETWRPRIGQEPPIL
jgi:hypothetical protein